GLPPGLELACPAVDVPKLSVAVRVVRTFARLAQPLQAVAEFVQQLADLLTPDLVPHLPEPIGQRSNALGRPPQERFGVTARFRRDERFQVVDQRLVDLRELLTSTARAPDSR